MGLRTRRLGWHGAFLGLLALAMADLALVETLAPAWRAACAGQSLLALGLAVVCLRRRVVLVVGPGGVELGRLVGPRRRRRLDEVGTAVITHGPRGADLVLRAAGRRRRLAAVRQHDVEGSVMAAVAALERAGTPSRHKFSRRAVPGRLAPVPAVTGRVLVVLATVAAVLVLPLPSRYVREPGGVHSATRALDLPPGYPPPAAGDVQVVATASQPAHLLAVLRSRRDPAVVIGSRAEILGPAPRAVAGEAERRVTTAAAQEAVAAAWRWLGVPVPFEGSGVEVLAVPAPMRSRLRPGDVVEAVDGRPTPTYLDFWSAVGATASGPVRLGLRRGGQRLVVEAPPSWYASGQQRLVVAPADSELRGVPFPVEVHHRNQFGNSAVAVLRGDHLGG